MTIKSTQGYEVLWDVESSFGTAGGSAFNIRTAGNPTFPTISKQVVDPEIGGYSHFADGDKPVQYEGPQENAITVPLHIRRASAGAKPPLVVAAESCGFAVTNHSDTTASGSHTTSSTDTAGDLANSQGSFFLCYDSTGKYWWPQYSIKKSGTYTHTWLFDLPNAQTDGDGLLNMYSLTPRADGAVDTITQYFRTRANHTAATDDLQYTYAATACGNFGSLELKTHEVPVISPTFHVLDVAKGAQALANESFRCTEDKLTWGGSNAFVGLANTPSTITDGGLTRTSSTEVRLIEGSFNFGVTTMMIKGMGGVNGYQDYISVYDRNAVSLTMTLAMPSEYGESTNKWESFFYDWESDDNVDKSIILGQGVYDATGSADPAAPCWGLAIPRAHLASEPVHDPSGDGYHKVTVTYKLDPSGADTSTFDHENAPYCLGIYTPSA